jgi:hypothetical protein
VQVINSLKTPHGASESYWAGIRGGYGVQHALHYNYRQHEQFADLPHVTDRYRHGRFAEPPENHYLPVATVSFAGRNLARVTIFACKTLRFLSTPDVVGSVLACSI